MATWLPVESNPEVLTKFVHELGVSSFWSLTDVFGLEPEHLEWVPKPVKAVILLCSCTENFEQHNKTEDAKLEENPPTVPDDLFYMKQYIHNSCGTIALLHAIANNPDVDLQENSILKKYLDAARNLSPEKRGKLFETFSTIGESHHKFALEGQTDANSGEPVNYHFVTYVNHNGDLYELDGRRSYPVKHGNTSANTLLEDAAKVCKAVMSRDPDDLRFTVIALVPNQN